jgi:hypothetical protein
MNSKFFLYYIFLFATVIGCVSTNTVFGQNTDKPKYTIKEKLNYPFGSLLKMKVEIFDGDLLNDKIHEGSFLFKIKSVDSISLSNTILMEFRDETDKFPQDDFELYKYLYGKDIGEISSHESKKMRKEYVGREFNIVAYETGEFTGIPNGYFKYQPVRQDVGFHFKNYLVVVADLTKK